MENNKNQYEIVLSLKEKIKSLEEIEKRLQTSLHVYEKAENDKRYDYKSYIYAIIIYVASIDSLFEYDLTNVIINLNSILISDFKKIQYRKIILDSKRLVDDIKKQFEKLE